jgi:hypothetical protein
VSHKHSCLTWARMAVSTLTVALVLVASTLSSAAQAAPSLTWSAPTSSDPGNTPSAVSCASESLCVVVDHQGNALSTSDPTAADPSWSSASIDPGLSLDAVSCAPGGPCVAVDESGYAFAGTGLNATGWSGEHIDGNTALTGVSCPTASLCVAVDAEGNVLASPHPSSGGWALASSHPGHRLTAVSCSSPSLCVAVDDSGEVLWSGNPTGAAGEWHQQRIDGVEPLLAVSCSAAGSCVAIDSAGNSLASADPTAAAPTWSETAIGGEAAGVSCASSGVCVVVGHRGQARASDDPTAPIPSWAPSTADTSPPEQALAGVSCLAGGFCLAVDASGQALPAHLPAPGATTLKPTLVTTASATLAGVVNPNDVVLGACAFEYGSAGAGVYSQTIPCSLLPAAVGGPQEVSASVSLLANNTTYHYRVLALSPQGRTAGADEAFTTATSSLIALVHPNPSISGTPANGQRLTCHPNLPEGASAQLTYAWLRDQIPIAGASASSYTVKGQDTGHHLQCQVTATDGGGSVTANSAFVTIPIGGVPASAGETTVGTPSFSGKQVSVPLSCSTLASNGCEVTLRLSAVETRSGARILAIAARPTRRAHNSAAGLRHLTVTLASARAHLPAGAHTTLVAVLSSTGRRLLAARRRFSANLSVSGTVIGVIQAQLAQKLLTLNAPSHSASTHAAHRR